ncbi:hypothetical protein Trydic_g21473 [Trypoxylus dichotomus]
MKIGGPTTSMSCPAIPSNSVSGKVVAKRSGNIELATRLLVFAIFAAMQASLVPVQAKCRFKHAQNDPILLTMCEARCLNDNKDKLPCVKTCLRNGVEKPGVCPDLIPYVGNATQSPFAAVCMETCWKDFECPGVLKCCRHKCGVTCQHPLELQTIKGVPPIPTDITIKERRRKKAVIIEWKPGEQSTSNKNDVFYIVQERHFTGKHLLDEYMSEWTSCMRTTKLRIRHTVKPGRWYQFRVAAVNENGTRGFSEKSLNFIFSTDPKPPKQPYNVQVGPLWARNGTVNAEVRWTPPQSDLPIQRYNVFWSRRLNGATDSVLVRMQSVPKVLDFTIPKPVTI